MTVMFAVKLIFVLGTITVLFFRGEAAGVCGQRSRFPTTQALPGKPGKNRAPGVPAWTQGCGRSGWNNWRRWWCRATGNN